MGFLRFYFYKKILDENSKEKELFWASLWL